MKKVDSVSFFAIGDPIDQIREWGKKGYRQVGSISVVAISFNTSQESLKDISELYGFPMSIFENTPFSLLKGISGYVYVDQFTLSNVI